MLAILIALRAASWNTKKQIIYTCDTSGRERCYDLQNGISEEKKNCIENYTLVFKVVQVEKKLILSIKCKNIFLHDVNL